MTNTETLIDLLTQALPEVEEAAADIHGHLSAAGADRVAKLARDIRAAIEDHDA